MNEHAHQGLAIRKTRELKWYSFKFLYLSRIFGTTILVPNLLWVALFPSALRAVDFILHTWDLVALFVLEYEDIINTEKPHKHSQTHTTMLYL